MTRWIAQHRRSVLFLVFILAGAGALRALSLPVALFPRAEFPRVVVSVDAGDRPAGRMITDVTRPVEEALRSVPDARDVRSLTTRGSAEVAVNFNWGRDMVTATLQTESALNQIRPDLPQGTRIEVRRMDPTVFPVIAYSLTSTVHSMSELRDVAEFQLRPVLTSVAGVASVVVQGGDVSEVHVTLRPEQLEAYNLTLDDVSHALESANTVQAVGRLDAEGKLYLVLADSQFAGLDEVREIAVATGADGVVALGDVANVRLSSEPNWTRVTSNGRDAVLLLIYQQIDGNTVQIATDVERVLAAQKAHVPEGVELSPWYDQSALIRSSAASVRDAVLIGSVLAALVLLFFLRNLRMTLITAICVPLVLAITVLLLGVLGMSFNIMTLGGMAAAVGLIVDDSIVMSEHIARRRTDGTVTVMGAAREMTRPLLGSSLSTVVIFAPLAYLSGVTGAFFRALSITMAAALIVSFFVAWLVVPVLADWLLRETEQTETPKPAGRYAGMLGRLLRRPLIVVVPVAALLATGWIAYKRLGSGFMPAMDEGGFVLDYRTPAGTSLQETDSLIRQVENVLQTTPEVRSYSRRTGLQLGGGVTEANEGDFFVRLIDLPRRPLSEVIDQVRQRLDHDVPGLTFEIALLMEDLIGDLTAVPQPIEIKIFANDETSLPGLGAKVAKEISSIPGVVDVSDGVLLAGDALDISFNRVALALEGVDIGAATATVASALDGAVTPGYPIGQRVVGVRVMLPADARNRVKDVGAVRIRAPDGHTFPLSRVATIARVSGQPQIVRENFKPMVAVTARLSGRDLGSVIADVRSALNKSGTLPPDAYYQLGGLYQQQQEAFRGLVRVLAGAALLVILLLLFMYESFRVVAAITVTTSLALVSVLIGLWLSGTELNITAMMGTTMVVGIVTEVAIFYMAEFVEQSALHGPERLIAAGERRMRAIVMTTIAAILALSPLALGLGEGAAMQQPLAIAIISGLVAQLPLVLIGLPALLRLFRADVRSSETA